MGKRDGKGRFKAELKGHALLDEIARTAKFAADHHGIDPQNVSMFQWDAAKRAIRTKAPSSETVRRRLRLNWFTVLSLALNPDERDQNTGAKPGYGRSDSVPPGRMIKILRWASFELDAALTIAAYSMFRDQQNEEITEARNFKRPLPSSESIAKAFGSWHEALDAAGVVPVRSSSGPYGAQPAEVLLDRFIDRLHAVPPKEYFKRYWRAKDVAVPERGTNNWKDVIEKTRKRRAARGLLTPGVVKTADLPKLGPSRRTQTRVTEAEIITSLQLYTDKYLEPGQRPTQRHYREVASGNDELVSPSTLARYGTFTEFRSKAGI